MGTFLAKNPGYTEVSRRSLLEWARKSGFLRQTSGRRESNDKPGLYLEIPSLGNGSVDAMIKSIAPVQPRNYIMMEVKGNLLKDSREALLQKFPSDTFKKVAHVQLGEPGLEFKKRTQEVTLKGKQEQSDKDFKWQKAQEKREKEAEKKRKAVEKAKKKAMKEAAKKQKELKKAAEAEKKEAEKKEAEKKKEDEAGE